MGETGASNVKNNNRKAPIVQFKNETHKTFFESIVNSNILSLRKPNINTDQVKTEIFKFMYFQVRNDLIEFLS